MENLINMSNCLIILLDIFCVVLIFYGDLGLLNFCFIGFKSFFDFDKLVDNVMYVGGERRIDRVLEKLI